MHGWRVSLRRNAVLLCIAGLCGSATWYAVRAAAPGPGAGSSPLGAQVLQIVAVEGHVLVKSFAPAGLTPFSKPLHAVSRMEPAEVMGSAAFVALWLAALTRRARFLLPWIASFTLLVAPFAWTTSWKNPDVGDRYATASHLLLAGAVACAFARVRCPNWALAAGAAAWAAAWAVLSMSQVGVWRNDLTLAQWVESRIARDDPLYPGVLEVSRSETAVCRYLMGDFDGAIADIDVSLRISPANAAFLEIRRKIVAMREWSEGRTKAEGARPPIPRVLEHLSIASAALTEGDGVKAGIHLDEIGRLDPAFRARMSAN